MTQKINFHKKYGKQCYVCGKTKNLHLHEIFFGTADRKKSIKYGLQVYLCGYHHNLSSEGVHSNHKLNYELKAKGQIEFEKIYSHKEFMNVFKRNYLTEEDKKRYCIEYKPLDLSKISDELLIQGMRLRG